jgi:hypothetical protein
MRLGGWQRIGVVASAVWLPCGAVYGCHLGLAGNCNTEEIHALMAFYAFAPVVAGWIVAWGLVWAGRWIWSGFVK